jgi:hypothetical protein
MNPYVFIVGCARSGTALLRRIVDAHPQIAITPETHWIAKWFERGKGVTPDGLITPELLPRLLAYERFARMGIEESALRDLIRHERPLSYARFVKAVFDLYGEAHGTALVGDKTPPYVRRIPTLHALWPAAKFVHLIRDGRDVVLSTLAWDRSRLPDSFPWEEDPVTTAAVWWNWHVSLGIEAGRDLGPELYYEIRYESLVSRPAEECARLCEFLGLPYDEAMLRFHEGRERHEPGLSAKDGWWPITAGLRDWRLEMPADQIERVEAVAGDLLEELGYPRAASGPRPEHSAAAALARESFVRQIKARRERVPEAWAGLAR